MKIKNHYIFNIKVPDEPSAVEQFALSELDNYLKKIKLKGKNSKNNENISYNINIGRGRWLNKDLIKKINDLKEDGYLLKINNNNIIICGNNDRGTLYGVYQFLQELGCFWPAPDFDFYGEDGAKLIPEGYKKIFLNSELTIKEPDLKYRKAFVEEGNSHNISNLKKLIDWMPKAGFNVFNCPIDYRHRGQVKWDKWKEELIPELKKRGILIEVGGHGYENFLSPERYFNTHPEWFGLINGKRSSEDRTVFCTSNKDAVEQFLNNIVIYLDKHPEIDIFDLWPPDAERWCECNSCKKIGTTTLRHARLVNKVIERLKKESIEVQVQFLAYSRYTVPPDSKIDKNSQLDFCPIRRDFHKPIFDRSSEINSFYLKSLRKWVENYSGDISYYSYYKKYRWRSLPILIPLLIVSELSYLKEEGINGHSIYCEPGDWITYETNLWISSRVAWDINISAHKLIKEYCNNRFGPAARPIQDLLTTLNQISATFTPRLSSSSNRGVNINSCYELNYSNQEELDNLLSAIKKCKSLTKKAENILRVQDWIHGEKAMTYICYFRKSINYVILDIKGEKYLRQGDKEKANHIGEKLQNLINESGLNNGVFLKHKTFDNRINKLLNS